MPAYHPAHALSYGQVSFHPCKDTAVPQTIRLQGEEGKKAAPFRRSKAPRGGARRTAARLSLRRRRRRAGTRHGRVTARAPRGLCPPGGGRAAGRDWLARRECCRSASRLAAEVGRRGEERAARCVTAPPPALLSPPAGSYLAVESGRSLRLFLPGRLCRRGARRRHFSPRHVQGSEEAFPPEHGRVAAVRLQP